MNIAQLFRQPATSRVSRFTIGIVEQVLTVGTPFLANFLLARSTSRANYGTFTLLYSVYIFISGLHNAFVQEAMLVFGAGRYREQFAAYFRFISRIHLLLVLQWTLLLVGATLLLSVLGSQYYHPEEYSLAIVTGVLLSGNWMRFSAYAQGRPEVALRMTLVFSIVACSGVMICYHTGTLNANRIFIILALGWLATIPLLPQLTDWSRSANFDVDRRLYWREHWTYSRWTLATSFVFQLMNQAYYWMLAAARSVESVGDLRAAHNLVKPTDLMLTATAMLAIPGLSRAISEGNLVRFRGLVGRLFGFGFVLSVITAIPLELFGGKLLHFVYGGKYDGLVPVLQILALVPCLTATGNALNDALKVALRNDAVFYSYLAAGLVAITFGPWLVRMHGEIGAAWGLLASAAVYCLSLGIFYCRLPAQPVCSS